MTQGPDPKTIRLTCRFFGDQLCHKLPLYTRGTTTQGLCDIAGGIATECVFRLKFERHFNSNAQRDAYFNRKSRPSEEQSTEQGEVLPGGDGAQVERPKVESLEPKLGGDSH